MSHQPELQLDGPPPSLRAVIETTTHLVPSPGGHLLQAHPGPGCAIRLRDPLNHQGCGLWMLNVLNPKYWHCTVCSRHGTAEDFIAALRAAKGKGRRP